MFLLNGKHIFFIRINLYNWVIIAKLHYNLKNYIKKFLQKLCYIEFI